MHTLEQTPTKECNETSFCSLSDLMAELPPAQRRRIEKAARRITKMQNQPMPARRKMLISITMEAQANRQALDNDLRLAWFLWFARTNEHDFRIHCAVTPPRQLIHVLHLLHKINRHPNWSCAQQVKPDEQEIAGCKIAEKYAWVLSSDEAYGRIGEIQALIERAVLEFVRIESSSATSCGQDAGSHTHPA